MATTSKTAESKIILAAQGITNPTKKQLQEQNKKLYAQEKDQTSGITIGGQISGKAGKPTDVLTIGGPSPYSATSWANTPLYDKGQQQETLAQQLFNYYAPGENYEQNKNSYMNFAYKILSGQEPMPDMSKPQGYIAPYVAPTDQQGITSFNTGNPEMDNWLNTMYLPLLEAEFSNDPLATLNPEAFKKISEKVEATFGDTFKSIKGQIQKEFELKQTSIDLARQQQLAPLEKGLAEVGMERTRLGEDVTKAKKREARNYQTAIQEAQAAFASAGRAFGGGRIERERLLGEQSQEKLSSIEEEEKRRLEDLAAQEKNYQTQQGFIGQEYGTSLLNQGLQGQELAMLKAKQEQELIDKKLQAFTGIKQGLVTQAQSILENPEIYKSLLNK